MTATAIERWVCFRLDSRHAFIFETNGEAVNWLKDPNRRQGWFISPVYVDRTQRG